MFPVTATPRFNTEISRLSQRLYFAGIEDPELELKKSLLASLVNVRTFPEAYPPTGEDRRRFTFEHRSVPYTVLYTFDGELITLHDIHFSRSARTAYWLE